MPYRIALVEDEAHLRENYAAALRQHRYDVTTFADRPSAENSFNNVLPDLAIIDIGLGDEVDGGFSLCRTLRARSAQLPIMFLSARDSDFDIVSGLRLGADDYVTKDISLPHLLARIAALLRRLEAMGDRPQPDQAVIHGLLQVDQQRMECCWRDEVVPLTLTEFWIVLSLVRHPGHVRSRSHLMNDANLVVDDASISTHIKRIRNKFRQIDSSFDSIETLYGMGYRWQDS
ncbi:MAG: proteobacterial dedicated sortase system response regulator [Pseudomonadota bacterium]